jgi:hypothetical protein
MPKREQKVDMQRVAGYELFSIIYALIPCFQRVAGYWENAVRISPEQ